MSFLVFGFYMVQPRFAKNSEDTVANALPLLLGSLSSAGLISWAPMAYPRVSFPASQRMGQVELVVASFLKVFPDRSTYACQVAGTGRISREEFMLGLVFITN